MKVTILGKKYLVRFKHDTRPTSRMTECFLIPLEEDVKLDAKNLPEQVAYGLALCHFNDNFERKIGRKLAFTRLIKNMAENDIIFVGEKGKEIRTSLWHEYMKNFKV